MPPDEPSTSNVVFVVLAGGAGSRWQGTGHKLAARLADGRSVLRSALDSATDAASVCDATVIVVTGSLSDLREAGCAGSGAPAVDVVTNPDWMSGQRSSLLAGLDRAERLAASAAVIGLADQPFVSAHAWAALARCRSPLAVALYGRDRGHPVRLDRSLWDEVRALRSPPDEGLRSFIGLHPELVEEVPCEGSPTDIDTVEDLDRWT